jgi:hypothetical protein
MSNMSNFSEEFQNDMKNHLREKMKALHENISKQNTHQKNSNKSDEKYIQKSNIFAKAKSFGQSMVSRGLNNKKCKPETKELRHLSCHGDATLSPCSERKESSLFPGSFYCGACGCGDKKGTQLVNITVQGTENYSKLDYPVVSCPLKMPGFKTYVSSETGVSENNRKKEIENRFTIEYIKSNST